jgi:hypothetical protein
VTAELAADLLMDAAERVTTQAAAAGWVDRWIR